MKNTIVAFIILFISATTIAQNTFSNQGESDPVATKILDKVKAKYESYKTLEATFILEIEFPGDPKEVQKGHIIQKGEKYRLDFENQTMVSNGEILWLHMKSAEEVQINDVEEEEGGEVLSPSSMFKIYETEDFVYALINEIMEDGVLVQQIEFKPLDKDSEYSKIRLSVNKKTSEIIRMKSFSKDGARYTLIMGKLTPNKTFPDSTFIFDKKECPDCHYEDVRI